MGFIKKYKNVLAGLLINTVEHHSTVLYGYYASLMAPIFFPADDPKLNEMRALGVFALTFVMQPVAGFILGRIGDLYGRKLSMIVGVLSIAIPTLLIGILPGYETLGIIAPILLIFALMIQSAGGAAAYSGTAVFLNEFGSSKVQSLLSALLSASGFIGAIIASFCGALYDSNSEWRLSFIGGGILGLLLMRLRSQLEETPVFKKSLREKGLHPSKSFLEVIKSRKRNFICAIGIAGGCNLPFYLICIYFNSLLVVDLGVPHPSMLKYNMGLLAFWGLFLPLVGHISDKVGIKRLMMVSALGLVFLSIPFFAWTLEDLTLTKIHLLRGLLSIFAMGILAPGTAYIMPLFEVQERQTGSSVAYAVGAVLFGGTAPFICRLLVDQTGHPIAPAYYLAFCGLMTAASIWYAKPVEEEE